MEQRRTRKLRPSFLCLIGTKTEAEPAASEQA